MALHLNLPPLFFGYKIPIHAVLEGLAYFLGFQFYRHSRLKHGDFLSDSRRYLLVVTAILGALLGSKIPSLFEHFLVSTSASPLATNKTIVGGLLGGFAAVEGLKSYWKIRINTGKYYVFPLLVGITIGRLGCFLAGPRDGTWGRPSALPFAIDSGDGISRHPAPLYEILFLGMIGIYFGYLQKRFPNLNLFRVFLASYFIFRIGVDSLKEDPRIALGLSSIQWVCVIGLFVLAVSKNRWIDATVPN